MTRRDLFPVFLQASSKLNLDPKNIAFAPPDLKVPPTVDGPPKPGLRVRIGTAGLYHVLYLPEDWKPGGRYPVIVEFPGNRQPSLLTNIPGDMEFTGAPEDTALGYGLSGGRGFLWLALPFVADGGTEVATSWWGDPLTTVDYCRRTVLSVCADFGGDPRRILLSGFSRGSIACNFMGLHNDSVAGLWRAFFCHSHYDGVRRWPYPGSDRDSALARLQRLKGRPQWISHESSGNEKGLLPAPNARPKYVGSVEEARQYVAATGIAGDFTYGELPYTTHTNAWVLRPILLRATARRWVRRVLER